MSFSAARFASALSVDLTINVRQTFSSAALTNARASIPAMSIPFVLALFRVLAVDKVTLFKLVMIVVLGVVLMVSFECSAFNFLLQPVFMQGNRNTNSGADGSINDSVVDTVA